MTKMRFLDSLGIDKRGAMLRTGFGITNVIGGRGKA
jgi:hypothetical protein